jgi:hypothetical protein
VSTPLQAIVFSCLLNVLLQLANTNGIKKTKITEKNKKHKKVRTSQEAQ